jgi:hypothetical protein
MKVEVPFPAHSAGSMASPASGNGPFDSVHAAVSRLQVRIGLLDDPFKDWQLHIAESLDVETDPARGPVCRAGDSSGNRSPVDSRGARTRFDLDGRTVRSCRLA